MKKSLFKKYYYIGIGLYCFSFLLPSAVIFSNEEPMIGFQCALSVISLLFEYENLWVLILRIFVNLANLITIFLFIIHFKIKIQKLYIFQLIAFASSAYWFIRALFESTVQDLLIGYWNWVFSILFIFVVMFHFRNSRNKINS